jgi:mRNA-degrading endonuclease RelE of RelBE toxin-antitoxin system
MTWRVVFSRRAAKQKPELPQKVVLSLEALVMQIRFEGPVRGDWPNYSKLGKSRHHCHIRKGRPTYVAVWEEVSGHIKLVEIVYVGTHEDAPY